MAKSPSLRSTLNLNMSLPKYCHKEYNRVIFEAPVVCYGIPRKSKGDNAMPILTNGRKYYRTNEVYRMVGISRNTLFNWLHQGILGEVELRDRRGWRLFTEADIKTLQKEACRIITVNRRKGTYV